MLAQAVFDQGRLDEAGALCEDVAATAAADDIGVQIAWRGVRAKVLAHAGDVAAPALARDAVTLAEATDLLNDHGNALLDLAEVLRIGGDADDADDAVRRALALFERKGNAASASKARARLLH
jgi:hypothetical protein